MEVFKIEEHESISDNRQIGIIQNLCLNFSVEDNKVKYLNLSSNLTASYIIGIDWLKENEYALMVSPKIKNLDYLEMFMHCFNSEAASKELEKVYKINFDKAPIKIPGNNFQITPLLIVHFLKVVENIVRKGLKKDFTRVSENLNSKIKGKVILSRNFKTNILKGRSDRNFCTYQDYTADCIENKIIKKALGFVDIYLSKNLKEIAQLRSIFNYCYSAFSAVTDDIDIKHIKQPRLNPLYKEYTEAIYLSKMIFKRFGYSIHEASTVSENNLPPFWIDMSKLFELYVLCKLKDVYKSQINYQVHGNYGDADFLKIDDKIIIDTKYKLLYVNDNKYNIDNVRQLSGYARDKRLLRKMDITDESTVVDCLIIYPDLTKPDSFVDRKLKEEKIDQFIKFFKIGISLPIQ